MRQFIPIGKFHTHQQPSWFSSYIRHLINCLRILCHRFRNNPTNSTDDKIKALETLLQGKVNESKFDNESSLVNEFAFSNNNRIFKYSKTIIA